MDGDAQGSLLFIWDRDVLDLFENQSLQSAIFQHWENYKQITNLYWCFLKKLLTRLVKMVQRYVDTGNISCTFPDGFRNNKWSQDMPSFASIADCVVSKSTVSNIAGLSCSLTSVKYGYICNLIQEKDLVKWKQNKTCLTMVVTPYKVIHYSPVVSHFTGQKCRIWLMY